ncbi:MAG: DUF3536 domain-containing protein [Ignavibacteriaceae bacterium]
MNRYVCIHGHFYQPPRENPWLEEIEVQDSAYPYRDWNDRITAECYSPNTAARILSNNKTVVAIINNYSKISFNFGPTLLSWMEAKVPYVYEAILKADEEGKELYSGHGSAIAQVYNHMIMPLSNTRDKRTQILWGVEDFKHRFKREPEGMWLAETAVDIESLDIMAEMGIKYTILAPRQAKAIKPLNSGDWEDVSNGTIDPKRAYLCRLPSGRTINLFFYDGPISQELAFGDLLANGENLANRLAGTFIDNDEPQLAHIATDGETYGHHQKHGDMALAYCLNYIDANNHADITIYGEFLEKNPPEYEVEIIENTSWSCIHGIERWRSDCGCNSGRPDWNQQWRAPLREALDWLRETLIPIYEKEAAKYTSDVWKLRDEYVKVILNRSSKNIDKFFTDNGIKKVSDKDRVILLKLLEMQRHAMLMYTSCGWFFDEISGIETVQVVLYAARAIQLTKELELGNLEPEFVKYLEKIPTNIPDLENGARVYQLYVKPAIIDLLRVAAHYAVSSIFEDYSESSKIFCYEVLNEDYELFQAGKIKMIIGRSKMRSGVTHEEVIVSYAFLHLGDQNLNGGVRESKSIEAYQLMKSELKAAFEKINIAEIILLIDKHFGTHNYSLWHLFKDQSRKVFDKIMKQTLDSSEHAFRNIYDNYYPVMQAMKDTDTPLPKYIKTAVEFIINSDMKKILSNGNGIDVDKLQSLSKEAKKWNIDLEKPALSLLASHRVDKLMEQLIKEPMNFKLLNEIETSVRNLNELEIDLNIWRAQNILFMIYKEHFDCIKEKADNGDKDAAQWVEKFSNFESYLQVRIR